MRKRIRMLALLMVVLLIAAAVAGCSGGTEGDVSSLSTSPSSQPSNDGEDPAASPEGDGGDSALPIADGGSFELWYCFSLANTVITTYNDSAVFQELERRTGVRVEFIHPSFVDYGVTAFRLLLASQDYPDAFFTSTSMWTLGLDSYIEDDVIIALNDLIEQYAPNVTRYLNMDEYLRKDSTTDAGYIAGFPQIQYQTVPGATSGPVLRKDIMDNLGLEIPETYSELHDVIAAINETNGMTFAYVYDDMALDGLLSGYNVCGDFMYNADGKVVYTRIQDGWRDYLSMLNSWYEEGIIDPNFMMNTNFTATIELLSTDKALGSSNSFAAYIGATLAEGVATDANLNLVSIPYPKVNAGDQIHAGTNNSYTSNYGFRSAYQISGVAEDPELITRWFDYMYTDEGILLTNYGFEGETFEYDENGKPVWTALIRERRRACASEPCV